MSFFQKAFSTGLGARIARGAGGLRYWALPVTVGAGWLLWPAIDLEWKMELGLAGDPEDGIKKVQAAKMKRMELVLGQQAKVAMASPKEDDEEEEEEEEGDAEGEGEEEAGGEGEGGGEEEGGDEEGGDEDGGEGGDDEEEEEKSVAIKPLYVVIKPPAGIKLPIQQMWDNFAIKAVKMTEEDDGTFLVSFLIVRQVTVLTITRFFCRR
jgi:hypothetical protein